jgi:AraC family transcriptional regulator
MILNAIGVMRQHFGNTLSLGDMADAACLSPFHFHRVFHRTIGIAPGEYLAALRLEAAKRLLITGSESVTDICFAVGYNSPGTFTTRFTKLVGAPPLQLRQLGRRFADYGIPSIGDRMQRAVNDYPALGGTAGRVSCPPDFTGLIFVGLFPKRVPQSMPVAGTLLTEPGSYKMEGVPDGAYYVLAAAVPVGDIATLFVPSSGSVLVGIGESTLKFIGGHAIDSVDVALREPCATDPPLVVALPVLLVRNRPELLLQK